MPLKTDDVLGWITDCINEADSGGYESADSCNQISPVRWYAEGPPEIVQHCGGEMLVRDSTGAMFKVKVTRLRQFKADHLP